MTVMVHARVDPKVKEEANKALKDMGLTMSSAINVFLTRIAMEKQIQSSRLR